MNPDLSRLQPYPFERLAKLTNGVTPATKLSPISLGIGEPKHASPDFVRQALTDNLSTLSAYPSTKGLPELRQAIATWASNRFKLAPNSLNPEHHVIPCNGTREALFAITQAILDRSKNNPVVISPNPFYQIYEGAAYLAGAEPYFINCTEENEFLPDYDQVPEDVWERCQLLFVCSPGNPTGAVTPVGQLKKLIALADKYDFIIAADECYSEIYFDEERPPVGLLQACAELGRDDYKRCLVFHSLSKRSNLPGLRSGFVAGDADVLKQFLLFRTYHGSAMSIFTQRASIAAWQDETHVQQNRAMYRTKFDEVLKRFHGILDVQRPDAGFYLWAKTSINDESFAVELLQQQNIRVLPGSYLSRIHNGINPGENRIRMALVASVEECIEAADRIVNLVKSLPKP